MELSDAATRLLDALDALDSPSPHRSGMEDHARILDARAGLRRALEDKPPPPKVRLIVMLDGQHFEREADWLIVPRPGDPVDLNTHDGWTEEVERVWWDDSGVPTVVLGEHFDRQGEDLASTLREKGWR